SFSDLGDGGFVNQAGFDITNWNTYAIRWLPDRVQWLINGTQVREELQTVDGHPSEVRLNIWAPDPGFNSAYNASLQPTDATGNMEYELEIDYVKVSSTAVVPIPAALWLFASGLLGLLGTARRHRKV
ncbi:MAG: family 16 glycosylhydrolase, partial [Gammaproteobacteria bacterium]|nr:family 16 glycosylhydrolase [Gammaproteobacteria bacterium]